MSPRVMLLQLVLTHKSQISRQQDSVLPLAVRDGKEAVVRLLLRCGANTNRIDEYGKSALTYAIEVGNIAIVRESRCQLPHKR
jgi:ankyrin repeat protein